VSALVVRPIGPDEVELFTSFTDASPLGLKPPPAMYLDGLQQWYRPEWSWVALRDGQVVARVAFSGPPDARLPLAMGSLEIGTRPDRVATGLALVRAAYAAMTGGGTGEGGRPEYRQFLPVDWHQHAGMRAAVADRRTVARLAGLRFLVERVELRWLAEPGAALPPRPGRLTFRPVGDDDEMHAVVRGTVDGTLDAHARRDVARDGIDAAARAIVEELPGPRSLMRLAYDPAGRCAGITVPGLRPWGADISYVGVLPEHRGNGYADELLLEASHLLVKGGATEIVAATDVGNAPMAAAFARCGYRVVDRLLVHV
jgi:ribosomal protein S18 acetylase RimI-like enzyme